MVGLVLPARVEMPIRRKFSATPLSLSQIDFRWWRDLKFNYNFVPTPFSGLFEGKRRKEKCSFVRVDLDRVSSNVRSRVHVLFLGRARKKDLEGEEERRDWPLNKHLSSKIFAMLFSQRSENWAERCLVRGKLLKKVLKSIEVRYNSKLTTGIRIEKF